jgi:D-arabinose 1-dehydrogenase-like Zn-dependent alcohol dehydrogenase
MDQSIPKSRPRRAKTESFVPFSTDWSLARDANRALFWVLFQGMQNLPSLRVAIVGCGGAGVRYAALLGDARLVVTCDKDPRRAASLAATAHACFATNQLTEALSFRPDAVIVATPSHLSASVAFESLRAGAHVFLSHLGTDSSEIPPIYALAKQARRVIGIEGPDGDAALSQFLGTLRTTQDVASSRD